MRRSLIRLNVRSTKELFNSVDQSVAKATTLANEQHDKANFPKEPESKPQTVEERIASHPQLKDVYLSVNTKLGKEEILVRPTQGNPTGLTDLFQHPAPRETLLKIYDHTLAFIGDKYPATSIYRQSVENLTKARRDIVSGSQNIGDIESKVGSGVVEEIITQAADEFLLAEELDGLNVWENLEEKPSADQWTQFSFKDRPE